MCEKPGTMAPLKSDFLIYAFCDKSIHSKTSQYCASSKKWYGIRGCTVLGVTVF